MLLSGNSDDAAVRLLVAEICAISCPEDGLRFDISDLVVETIRAEEEYSGKRARFRAFLGNARITVQLDLGVGDALALEPEEIIYPTLLDTMPAPELRAYPREATIAEKFEAMVKLDTRNSRMKDFHDVWALAGAFEFEGPTLRKAIASCFERRGTTLTEETPPALTPAFYQLADFETRWRSYLAAGAALIPPPAQFEVIGERIIRFLGPLRRSIISGEAFDRRWMPEGLWAYAGGEARNE